MAEFHSLPLFTDAWVADTHHMTRLSRGTYMDLLILMWRSPDCRVPNDDEWLGQRLRMSADEIKNELRPIIAEFCASSGNWIFQKRLSKEWAWCQSRRQKGTDSAKSRWGKEKTSCEANAPNPILSYKDTPKPPKGLSAKEVASAFDRFMKAFPRRDGENPKAPAFKKFSALAHSGVDPDVIISGCERFAANCDARKVTGTKYVPQAITWLNQHRWESWGSQDTTAKPAFDPKTMTPDQWRNVLRNHMFDPRSMTTNGWHSAYGPEPGRAGCLVPPELLSRDHLMIGATGGRDYHMPGPLERKGNGRL